MKVIYNNEQEFLPILQLSRNFRTFDRNSINRHTSLRSSLWLRSVPAIKGFEGFKTIRSSTRNAPKQDVEVVSVVNEEAFIRSQHICDKLKEERVNIDEWTSRRRLHEVRSKFSHSLSTKLLTNKHRNNRFKWTQAQMTTSLDYEIFTDETTVRQNHVKKFAWNLRSRK